MWHLQLEVNEPMKHTIPKVLREIADTMDERSEQLSEQRTESDGASRSWALEEQEDA